MNESFCPSYPAIDPIGIMLYLLLAIGVMILVVSRLWKRHQPSCRQALFGPTIVLVIVLIVLTPIAQIINWYVLRTIGLEATAVVIDHRISPDAKALFPHHLDFMYRISGSKGDMCTLIQHDEPVPADVYKRYAIGSTIAIRYLPYNPMVAHTDSTERVVWHNLLVMLILGVIVTFGAYLKLLLNNQR